MNKKILTSIVISLAAIGIIAIGYMFINSLNPSAKAIANGEYVIDLTDIEIGKLKEFNIQGKPLYLYRPTDEQWKDIYFLTSHVWNTEYSGYDDTTKIFIYWGLSTSIGCKLEIHPKGKNLISTSGGIWLGGYFDVCRESSYDYAGRTIKTYEYTYNGWTSEVRNLDVPKYEISGNDLRIKLL